MSDDETEPLDKKEGKFHPRLLLLDEFGGELHGKKKFHKCLYHFREDSEDISVDDWTFTHDHFGPTEEGLSKNLLALDNLNLIVIEKDGKKYIYKETEKGSSFTQGLRNGLRKLWGDEIQEREKSLELVAEVNKDRSASEIIDDWKEQKEEPYGIDQ
ncbi:hypothetical protein C488_12713 [Natrinema pellirubrum DSM 15624]|uniref:Uncharacterized protein n=1 Tax=Natrinema pellirubrum (strain DSM 15624 / CIP 106293 / JCM 10476 / NCIMB 786 / 157) TaxID=797303 RepID=L0JQ66_NATP1|nr:hypothetical protein [Natrinema pellirubrum]AGB32526.1 hypothetical protein Natpe_2721 [Natrinema pellirubrum DSM 15624]ELY73665.1 hypothetical protein C488_12713 [Natrinema pellirubrum DSM 15624]